MILVLDNMCPISLKILCPRTESVLLDLFYKLWKLYDELNVVSLSFWKKKKEYRSIWWTTSASTVN